MREIDKYAILKEKLKGICDEHNLTYSIQNKSYPFLMTIKPLGGVDAQQTMLEGMEETGGSGYISPDASLVFAYEDGDLTYKISETWTISENLFNKLKNIFKKMHALWMQYFFRDIHKYSPNAVDVPDPTAEPWDKEPAAEEDEDTSEAFDEFLGETERALDDEDDEE